MTEEQALQSHETAQQLQVDGLHAEALSILDEVASYFRAAEGNDSPDLANVLADCAESLLALCRYSEAEADARKSVVILTAIADQLDADTRMALLPRVQSIWGNCLRELGRYDEAEAPLLAAIRECAPTERASHLNNYGVLCKYSGKFDEGERVYRVALHLIESEYGVKAVESATLYHNLGGLEHARGNFAAGEPLARTAYEIHRIALGEDDPRTIADAVAWGGLLDGLGRFDESLPIYERALRYYEERLGPEHFEVAATLNNLGLAYSALARRQDAIAALERALAIKRALFGPGDTHPEVALALENLTAVQTEKK